MDERIKKIADYYGYESQMDMLCEECGEFVQARNKLRRNVDGAYQNCLEEIADIAIMVEQMKLICGADRIEQIMNEKLDRQIKRICDEEGLCERYYPVYGKYAADGDLCINDGMSAGTCYCKGDKAKCNYKTAELPEVDTEGMQSGEIRTARNGDVE